MRLAWISSRTLCSRGVANHHHPLEISNFKRWSIRSLTFFFLLSSFKNGADFRPFLMSGYANALICKQGIIFECEWTIARRGQQFASHELRAPASHEWTQPSASSLGRRCFPSKTLHFTACLPLPDLASERRMLIHDQWLSVHECTNSISGWNISEVNSGENV